MVEELCQHSEQREQPDASGQKKKKKKLYYFALWWVGSNFRAVSGPAVSLRSCLRRGKYGAVIVNRRAKGAPKIAAEHIVWFT